MLKYLALFFFFLATSFAAGAQVKKKIKRGRRNKSESQFALARGDAEVDWEVGYETVNPLLKTLVYPNLALRYGVTDRLEVNMEFSHLTAYDDSVTPHDHATGTEPVNFGFNYLIIRDTDHSPALIFSGQLAIPWMASASFKANYYAPTLELILQYPIRKKLIVGLSGGTFRDGFSKQPIWIYNATTGYQFTEKWLLTGELFGFIGQGAPQHNIDLNLSYFVNKKLSFGFTGGTGLNAAAHQSYFSLNGIWGFSALRKKTGSPPAALR